MKEPLLHYFEKFGYDPSQIREFVAGEKYCAVMLNNGNIGVCATLNMPVKLNAFEICKPDFLDISYRIILNAWFNALLNYDKDYEHSGDIFDGVEWKSYRHIVMIGYFRPLVVKFELAGIPLVIFDRTVGNEMLTGMDRQMEETGRADCVILSGTTMQNMTFSEICNVTPDDCDIFLLGPSNILHTDMLFYRNIRMVFGSVFSPNDSRVLKIIGEGGGTPAFSQYMRKVFIVSDKFKC